MTRKSAILCLALGIFSAPTPTLASQSDWQINPSKSSIEFHLKNMGLKVDGSFKKLSGTVAYDDKKLSQSTVQAQIDPDSIDTGIGMRDKHLKTKDFFNVAKFPDVIFRSTNIDVEPSGEFTIVGTLTMHGVPMRVQLAAKPLKAFSEKDGQKHLTTTATTTIQRKSFDIGGLAAATVSNDVSVDLNIDLVKAAAQ
jgi:polyisoprenoid-binding protein YceI